MAILKERTQKGRVVMMVKQAIAVGSLLAGGATLGLIAYLDEHPRAETVKPEQARTAEEWRTDLPVPTPAYVEVPDVVPAQAVTEPEPPLPIPAATKPKVRRKPAQPVEHELVPCSEWREVGAAIIQEGGAVGSRTVRTLCSRPIR